MPKTKTPTAAADPVANDPTLARVSRETRKRSGADGPTVTGGSVTRKRETRQERADRLAAVSQRRRETVTDRERRAFRAVPMAGQDRYAENLPAARAAVTVAEPVPVPVGRSGRGVIPGAVAAAVSAARSRAAAELSAADPDRAAAIRAAADPDRSPFGAAGDRGAIQYGRTVRRALRAGLPIAAALRCGLRVRRSADSEAVRAAAAAVSDRAAAILAETREPETRKRETGERVYVPTAARIAALEAAEAEAAAAAYAAAVGIGERVFAVSGSGETVEAVAGSWGDPLPPVRRGIDLAEWRAAGGIVEVLPPVKRPRRKSPGVRRTRQTSGSGDPTLVGKDHGSGDPRTVSSGTGRRASLSGYGRAHIEAVALAAAAALVDRAGGRSVSVAVSLPDRAAAALADGLAVRCWITGLAYQDAGKVEGSDNPKRPRSPWLCPAAGSGRVRVCFAPGADLKGSVPLVGKSAGRLAVRLTADAAISPDRGVAVSMTGS